MNGDKVGRIVGIILKILQIVFFFLMILDVLSRFKGKPINSMHLMRFLTFTFCAATTHYIGLNKDGYIGFHQGTNSELLGQFYNKIYLGYYDTAMFKLFENPKINGTEYGFIYLNSLFFELIFYLLLALLSYVFASKLKENNPIAHLINSIRFILGCSLAMIYINNGIMWWKQSNNLKKSRKLGDNVEYNKWTFYITWIIVVFMFFEILGEYYVVVSSSTGTNQNTKSNFKWLILIR